MYVDVYVEPWTKDGTNSFYLYTTSAHGVDRWELDANEVYNKLINQDMAERIRVREIEDSLIKAGKMGEKDRMVFENKSKMIALSSASYSFENLYKTYKEWMGNIYSDDIQDSKYFISQMGYESIPTDMIDETTIERLGCIRS